jgi:hypothetical protein
VLAELPHIFGRGRSGEMTFYRTRRGAEVFAAGSMNFGGSALWPVPSRLLDNLWAELTGSRGVSGVPLEPVRCGR